MSGILGSSIARGAFAITKSASPLAVPAYGIYVGGAGDVVVTGKDGVNVTFTAVPAGVTLPINVTHVLTATTATNLVGYKIFTNV